MGRKRRGNGEGTIGKRASDGRWYATITIGRKPDGTPRRKTFYGTTRKEVRDKLTLAQRALEEGRAVEPSKQTVGLFLARWLEDIAAPRLKPKSLRSYRIVVEQHLVPGIGQIPLRDLHPQDVQHLLNAKRQAGLGATVDLMRTVLKSALKQAETWGLVSRNAAALTTAPRHDSPERRYLTADEARALLHAAHGTRDEAVYHVALLLGLRQGEILGLRWEDVDFASGTLRIERQLSDPGGKLQFATPKTAKSRRTLPLPAPLVRVLHAHRARQLEERLKRAPIWEEHGLVFPSEVGTPRFPATLRRSFKALLAEAGLPDVRFHDLRHACATLLAAERVPPRVAMEILGHATIAHTQEVYTHVLDESKRDAVDAIARVLDRKEAR